MKKYLLCLLSFALMFSCAQTKTLELKIDDTITKTDADKQVVEQWNSFIELSNVWFYKVDEKNLDSYNAEIKKAFSTAIEVVTFLQRNQLSPEVNKVLFEKIALFEKELSTLAVFKQIDEIRYGIMMNSTK